MKLLLLNIRIRENAPKSYPPMGLAHIASALKRAGIGFDLLDLDITPLTLEQLEIFFEKNHYDVVALGSIVTGYKYVKHYTAIIKRYQPAATIVLGNTVASSIPEIALSKTQADIAVMGEGDETMVDLINCLSAQGNLKSVPGLCFKENGALRTTGQREAIEPLDHLPFPDWDIFAINSYIDSYSSAVDEPLPPIPREQIRYFPISVSRGCPFNCSFCFHAFHGYRYRRRTSANIVKEMARLHHLYGINFFAFTDDLTVANAEQAEELADAINASGLKVFWYINCRSGMFHTDKHLRILEKMKKAGALSMSYSLESADPEILKWIDKKATPKQFLAQAQLASQVGIGSKTSLVFGYPPETEQTIRATIDCCLEAGIYPTAGFLLPLPGTRIYDYAVTTGKINGLEEYLLTIGDRQDLHVNLTQMTNIQFQDVVLRELERLANGLGLGLSRDKLIRTGYRRMAHKLPAENAALPTTAPE